VLVCSHLLLLVLPSLPVPELVCSHLLLLLLVADLAAMAALLAPLLPFPRQHQQLPLRFLLF
jgi:hypothetical protein